MLGYYVMASLALDQAAAKLNPSGNINTSLQLPQLAF